MEHNIKYNSDRRFFNPFPGLRPFSTSESHLFFGREGQSQNVLKFLADNRFVALLGTSGSGKSSLMYCGVIPFLQGGFIAKAGANWQIITTRPGQSPIKNMSDSLFEHLQKKDSNTKLLSNFIHSTLVSSSVGLTEVLKLIPRKPDENILILIDQFEELFRFKRIKNSTETINEVFAYIKLILETLNQDEVPSYVVLTMRSDFLGECSQFQSLTKLINDSHYLIPQMTRDDFRQAIEGPIAVGGGHITPLLVQQLLNDLGDNPDQLPALQHALMRTWDSWVKSGHTDEPIDVRDYDNIGRLEKALSEHANEAYNELDARQKEICQSIFKTLTEKGGDSRGVRRPTSISEISEITMATPQEIIDVVDHFRCAGRSFLSPAMPVQLTPDSVVDISHESLMRIWDKLILWVNEEYESVQMYKRLANSAERYHLGETSLWRPPDLQLALNWRNKQKPTITWAKRYNPAFERTMVFLETSQHEYQLEEENKINQQRKALKRSKIIAIGVSAAAIVCIYLAINAFIQKQQAEEQTIIAQNEKKEADLQRKLADEQKDIAERQTKIAQQKENEALEQKEFADKQKEMAEKNAKEAKRQQQIAESSEREAKNQQKIASEQKAKAEEQQKLAEEASLQAQKLRMLSISQSMAVKSLQINVDTMLRALVAYQSYMFNEDFGGNEFNNDVYNGLYFAQKCLYGNEYTDFSGHNGAVRSIAVGGNTGKIFTTSSDGKVLQWSVDNNKKPVELANTNNVNRFVLTDNSETKVLVGTDNGILIMFDLGKGNSEPVTLAKFKDQVIGGEFISDSVVLVSDIKGTLKRINIYSQKSDSLSISSGLKNIKKISNSIYAICNDSKLVKLDAYGNPSVDMYCVKPSDDRKTFSLEKVGQNVPTFDNDYNLYAFAFDTVGNRLATGDRNGNILIWDLKTLAFIKQLNGHTARINGVQFSSDGKLLAAASNDGKVLIWNTDDFEMTPISLTYDNDGNWVNDVKFSLDSKSIYAAYQDGNVRKWSTQLGEMADLVRLKISRDMTVEEWNQYVAQDIDYQKLSDIYP